MNFKKSVLPLVAVLSISSFASAKVYRYISIDSGGMLGVIPAHLLADIEEKTGKPIHELVDGMMGTSTGSIISALLTVPALNRETPYTAAEIGDFYRKHGAPIFDAATQSVVKNTMLSFLGGTPDFTAAAGVLQTQLEQVFGGLKMSKALVDLQILSLDATNSQIWLFESSKAKADAQHDVLVSDAVRASSSVANAFGPLELTIASTKKRFIDAGSIGARPNVSDPTPFLLETVLAKLGAGDSAIVYSLGTGFSRGSVLKFDDRKITVVRIEPNVQHLMNGKGMLAMNLLSASTTPEKLEQMVSVAESLKNSDEYQRMLADLQQLGREEL